MRYATAYLHSTITGRIHVAYFREDAAESGVERWRCRGVHVTGTPATDREAYAMNRREMWHEAWGHMDAMRRDFGLGIDTRHLGVIRWNGETPLTIDAQGKQPTASYRFGTDATPGC
jgi:hypothetical protein